MLQYSVKFVLFFEEILLSAYFTGPDQSELATSKFSPIMTTHEE
jgi:hypothetical protein